MSELPDYGPLPELKWLPLNKLVIDHNYQRELDSKHAQNILNDFMWRHFQIVTVTPIDDGLYAVIDGQHRVNAARNHPKIDEVPCAVLPHMSVEERALGFAQMNRVQKHIGSLALYWASLAGGDKECVALAQLMERVGVKVMMYPVTNAKLAKMSTTAISLIRRSVKRFGEEPMENTLLAMGGAWPEEEGVFSFQMIKAVEYLIRIKRIPKDTMIKTLEKARPFMFIADARELSGVGKVRIATALVEVISDYLPAKGKTKR